MMPKILGRDPAMWAALIQTALLSALAFDLFGDLLTTDHVGGIMAVVNAAFGLLTAILTKRAGLSFAIGLLQAVIALAAQYGADLTEQQTTAMIGFATIVLGFFNWAVNEPADNPGLREEYPPEYVIGELQSTSFQGGPLPEAVPHNERGHGDILVAALVSAAVAIIVLALFGVLR